MPRRPGHRYLDPLDHIWLAAAARIGLRVERSAEVYAATDGTGLLHIGAPADLDPDDCLAQMIVHELCHALVQGPGSFTQPDWGLDNESDRDVPREHACLRVQAALTGPHGLRTLLAPTTDFRDFYDHLPADPMAGPAGDPSVALARAAVTRADKAPFAPHLGRALADTAAIAHLAARWPAPDEPDLLPVLWRTVAPDAGD
jgi:hypothetical protein